MSEGKDDFDGFDDDEVEDYQVKKRYDEQKEAKEIDYDDEDEDDEGRDTNYGGEGNAEDDNFSDVFNLAKEYCRKPEFLKVFEQYIRDYVDYFDRDLYQEGEHPHEWHDYFQTYLKLFEDTLGTFIKSQGCEYTEFYQMCVDRQYGVDARDRRFVQMIMASLEYVLSALNFILIFS